MKIVFAASSGGHLEQLLMLKPLMEKYDSILVTEKTDYSPGKFNIKTYYMKQINRKEILFVPLPSSCQPWATHLRRTIKNTYTHEHKEIFIAREGYTNRMV